MAPIPLHLEQQFSEKFPYVDVPIVVPRVQGNNAKIQREARVKSILSAAVNTLTSVIAILVEENQSNVSKSEVQELQQQLLQEKRLKDQLQSQKADLKLQLDREKELVSHSKQVADRLNDKFKVLTLEKNKSLQKIKNLRRASAGYKALHVDLTREVNRRYVMHYLSAILKEIETIVSIHFSLDELKELEKGLITKIQDCSEEHSQPLFKELVVKYLQERLKDVPGERDMRKPSLLSKRMRLKTRKKMMMRENLRIQRMMMMMMVITLPHQVKILNHFQDEDE